MKTAIVRVVSTFIAVLLLCGSLTPSYADEIADNLQGALNADEMKRFEKLSSNEKTQIRETIVTEAAKQKCGDFWFYSNMELLSFNKKGCEELTREALYLMYPSATDIFNGKPTKNFCDSLEETGAPFGAVTKCITNERMAQNKINNNADIRNWLGQTDLGKTLLNLADALDNGIKFIADPKSALEELANSSKAESIALTAKVLEEISSTTEFDASSQAFKDRWALYAGLGIVGLGLMMLFLFKQHSNGEISDDDFSNSLIYYLPAALFLVVYGPWIMNEVQLRVAPLTDGTTDWAAEAITNFIMVVSRFASIESSSWFGPIAAIFFFGLLFIGAIALLIYFLLIPIFIQLMGLAIALLVGMLLSPKTRRYVLKIGSTLGMMALLKPAAFLVLGAVFSVLASQTAFEGKTDDLLVNVGNLGATAAIMLMIVLSPAALFRWMPVIESREAKFGGISPELSAGVGGAVGGAIGSGAGSVRRAISKRRNSAPEHSSGGANDGSGSATSGKNISGNNSPGSNSNTAEGATGNSPDTKNNGSQERSNQRDGGTSSVDSAPRAPAPGSGQDNASDPSSRANASETVGQGVDSNSGSDSPSNGSTSRGEGSSSGRHSSKSSRAKSVASVAATAAFTPLTAGAVGLLAGTKYAAANAAAQARMAADNADPDSWDSFKDR